jgi:hypothetical protein
MGRDKKYLKRITGVEQKEADYTASESDIGVDVGADIAEADTKRAQSMTPTRYQPSLRAVKHHPKKGKHPRRR